MPDKPSVIDLFSGVGGLSLGAAKAGFNIAAAVEHEKRILDSHQKNFPNSIHIGKDILSISGGDLLKEAKIGRKQLAGIIGGPPCQGFSYIGKRNVDDKRNQLFLHFFKITSEVKPLFFLAENVPGILNDQYREIRNQAFKLVEADYDLVDSLKITASDYGAATSRTRVFFLGIKKGITNSEKVKENILLLKTGLGTKVREALHALPKQISEDWIEFNQSWRNLTTNKTNQYEDQLNQLIEGVGDKDAINQFFKARKISGLFGTRHSKLIIRRYEKLKPGEQDYISKSVKLDPNGYCPTLRAGTDSSKGSFQAVRPIHYSIPRVISPREAARLQGFPDWFQFHETKWHSFRQIGNSVCPIVAEKVLSAIKKSL